MNETIIFGICIIVSIIGLLAIAGIVYFGQITLRNKIFKGFDNNSFWEDFILQICKNLP